MSGVFYFGFYPHLTNLGGKGTDRKRFIPHDGTASMPREINTLLHIDCNATSSFSRSDLIAASRALGPPEDAAGMPFLGQAHGKVINACEAA